jgi:hypothetical protein
MESSARDDQAQPLRGPNMPADNGLTALGMIMQLGGHMFLALMAFFTFTMLVVSGASGEGTGIMLLVGVSGIIRSGLHRSAGAALVNAPTDASGRDPIRLTTAYVWVGLAQSVLVVLVLKEKAGLDGASLAQMALALMAWPATLLVVTQTARFRRFRHGIAMPEDRGFEGAGVLMLLFGIIGAIFSVIMVVAILGAGPILDHWQGWVILLTMVLLGIRSIVHARAGAQAVSGGGAGRFSERAVSYVNWGIGSAAVAGGGLFLLMASGGAEGSFLAFIGVMVYMLLAWPLVVKTLVINRDVSLFGDEAGEAGGRAPDLGMTAFGWLMLALAVLGLAATVPLLVSDAPTGGYGGGGLESLMGSGILGGDLAARLGRSNWFSMVIAGVQLWAAIELITMSRRWKLATIAYGVIAALISLYVSLPLFEALGEVFDNVLRGGYVQVIVLGQVAMSLVFPIGAILLVNRSHPGAPTAQARLRERS